MNSRVVFCDGKRIQGIERRRWVTKRKKEKQKKWMLLTSLLSTQSSFGHLKDSGNQTEDLLIGSILILCECKFNEVASASKRSDAKWFWMIKQSWNWDFPTWFEVKVLRNFKLLSSWIIEWLTKVKWIAYLTLCQVTFSTFHLNQIKLIINFTRFETQKSQELDLKVLFDPKQIRHWTEIE